MQWNCSSYWCRFIKVCPASMFFLFMFNSHFQRKLITEILKAWVTVYVHREQTGLGSPGWRRFLSACLGKRRWRDLRSGLSTSSAFRPSMASGLDPGAVLCWAKLKSQVTTFSIKHACFRSSFSTFDLKKVTFKINDQWTFVSKFNVMHVKKINKTCCFVCNQMSYVNLSIVVLMH